MPKRLEPREKIIQALKAVECSYEGQGDELNAMDMSAAARYVEALDFSKKDSLRDKRLNELLEWLPDYLEQKGCSFLAREISQLDLRHG